MRLRAREEAMGLELDNQSVATRLRAEPWQSPTSTSDTRLSIASMDRSPGGWRLAREAHINRFHHPCTEIASRAWSRVSCPAKRFSVYYASGLLTVDLSDIGAPGFSTEILLFRGECVCCVNGNLHSPDDPLCFG